MPDRKFRKDMDEEIQWKRRTDWNYEDYSLNTRLQQTAGNERVVDALARACREKFGKDPDLTPEPSDVVYFRNAGLRRPRAGKLHE